MTDSTRLLDRLSRRASWRTRAKKNRTSTRSKLSCVDLTSTATLGATVSQSTRERLISDAVRCVVFEGMEPAEVSTFVNAKLDGLLVVYPWWFGRLRSDAPKKPVTDAQRVAMDKARQRKAEIQREAERPYVRQQE